MPNTVTFNSIMVSGRSIVKQSLHHSISNGWSFCTPMQVIVSWMWWLVLHRCTLLVHLPGFFTLTLFCLQTLSCPYCYPACIAFTSDREDNRFENYSNQVQFRVAPCTSVDHEARSQIHVWPYLTHANSSKISSAPGCYKLSQCEFIVLSYLKQNRCARSNKHFDRIYLIIGCHVLYAAHMVSRPVFLSFLSLSSIYRDLPNCVVTKQGCD